MVEGSFKVPDVSQKELEQSFEVNRMMQEDISAIDLLKDMSSAMSVAETYKRELEKRHERFEKEKDWPYMSMEEQKLIKHYQDYMEKVKVHQDKIMRTVSLTPPPAQTDSPPESPHDISLDGGMQISQSMSTDLGTIPIASPQQLWEKQQKNLGLMAAQAATAHDPTSLQALQGSTAMSSQMSATTMYTQVHIVPEVVSYKEMCTTGTLEDNTKLERMRKFVFDVKKQPKNGAEIMRGFEKRNKDITRNELLQTEDAQCLINLSSLFYDNLYKEEIKGQSMKHSYFVLAFRDYINGVQFKKDKAKNVIVSNSAALKVVKTLFEGQTRKIGANNFLRHIYTSKFSKIRIPEYQEKIIREILKTIKPQNCISDQYQPSTRYGTETRTRDSVQDVAGPGSGQNPLTRTHNERTTHNHGSSSDRAASSTSASGNRSEERGPTKESEEKKKNWLKRIGENVSNIFSKKDKERDKKQKRRSQSPAKHSDSQKNAQKDQNRHQQSKSNDSRLVEQDIPMQSDPRQKGNQLSQTQRNPAAGGQQTESDVVNDEYEGIRVILGAGAHGDQSRLSDIFLKKKRRAEMECSTSQDPYNTTRFLNQEIDDEILNKNCMLKDLLVDQHCDPAQEQYQVSFNERNFFKTHREILNGSHAPDAAPFDCAGKDMTDLCKHIVHQVLKSLVISTDLMPYTLRAMMKILVMKSVSVAHPSGSDDHRQTTSSQDSLRGKTKLGRNQIYMLADLMIGCWLNTGFRNPSCYGVQQPTDREKGFSHNLFQSCRVIFEHLFSFQTLPETKKHQIFDVKRINEYILQFRDFIYIFYTRIIDVDLPPDINNQRQVTGQSSSSGLKANNQTCSQVLKYSVNSSLVRMQDLQLLAEILKEQKVFIQHKCVNEIACKIDWDRFRNKETTYFLFTKMKRDRKVKVPNPEENEAAALKVVLGLTQHFPLVNSDLGLNSTRNLDQWHETVDNQDLMPNNTLNPKFTHAIKPDKKGKNPAAMLLRILYKQLVQMLCQNTVLLNETLAGGDMSFDNLLDLIRKRAQSSEDGSGVVIACQLMKKALKGLRLITRTRMIPEEKLKVKLVQNKLLERFSRAYHDKCKQEFYKALITQDLKLQSFENDVVRFVARSRGMQESIEKVIAQWHIAKISACEVSLCVYQNTKDEFPGFQGIYLTRNCPIDQEWMALAKLIQFEIFDTPKFPKNININQHQLVPRQNQLMPSARQGNQRIIYQEYKDYTDFTWVSILRPLGILDPKKQSAGHREITYLESLLLYLTTECRGIFQNLVRCDYMLESFQIKQVRQQIKAMLNNSQLQTMASMPCNDQKITVMPQKNIVPCLPDLSRLEKPGSISKPEWAARWLLELQAQWDLWNSLYVLHSPRDKAIGGCKGEIDDYIKYIEIDEKFSKMNFIQKSLRTIIQKNKETPLYLLEIDQLMPERNGREIKLRMINRDIKEKIQDHGNFLRTFNFFLDNLLCDLTQNNAETAEMSYENLVKHDAQTEKIRQSCQEFILRRIHNGLFDKIQFSDWDKNMLRVIYDRKKKMETGRNPDNPNKPLFKDNEKDLNLYKVSIDMLKQLPKEETPRAKRQLLNDALKLARHALQVLKTVEGDDNDYLFAYMMHYACTKEGKRRNDFRIFQQLVFMSEFGKGAGSQAQRNPDEDPIDIQFKGLMSKIIDESNEAAVKTLTRSSFLVF